MAGTAGVPGMPEGPAGPWLPTFAEECEALDPARINAFLPDGSGDALHTWELRGEYMDQSNVSAREGHCVITARRESMGEREYIAGSLSTAGLFEQRAGYVEARLWPPAGRGLWTFLWSRSYDRLAARHRAVQLQHGRSKIHRAVLRSGCQSNTAGQNSTATC